MKWINSFDCSLLLVAGDMGVSKNNGFSPQIVHFNRVFLINHPFWIVPLIAHRIHVWYIFSYMKTIKINHSCRYIYIYTIHGSYG